MKAVCWMGKSKVETLTVEDPKLLNPHDAIRKITRTAICGSDLHLYDGFIPTMESGDILGHEFMGIVEEVGEDVTNLRRGDRVVVPFTIACGNCLFCKKEDLVCLRQQQSQRPLNGSSLRIFRFRPLQLLPHDGWICWRSGTVCTGSICKRWPIKDRERSSRREGSLSLRYISDRIHGG